MIAYRYPLASNISTNSCSATIKSGGIRSSPRQCFQHISVPFVILPTQEFKSPGHLFVRSLEHGWPVLTHRLHYDGSTFRCGHAAISFKCFFAEQTPLPSEIKWIGKNTNQNRTLNMSIYSSHSDSEHGSLTDQISLPNPEVSAMDSQRNQSGRTCLRRCPAISREFTSELQPAMKTDILPLPDAASLSNTVALPSLLHKFRGV